MSRTDRRSRTGLTSSMDRTSSGCMTSSMDRMSFTGRRFWYIAEDQTGRSRGVGLAIPQMERQTDAMLCCP